MRKTIISGLQYFGIIIACFILFIGAMVLMVWADGAHARSVRDKFVESLQGTVVSQSYVNYHLQYIYWVDKDGNYFKTTIEGNDSFTEPTSYQAIHN